jgi:hypothetical protein
MSQIGDFMMRTPSDTRFDRRIASRLAYLAPRCQALLSATALSPSLRALAKQSRATKKGWIASSQELLAMTNSLARQDIPTRPRLLSLALLRGEGNAVANQ